VKKAGSLDKLLGFHSPWQSFVRRQNYDVFVRPCQSWDFSPSRSLVVGFVSRPVQFSAPVLEKMIFPKIKQKSSIDGL
jgi:hypothetical protein|tara:strand:+ start:1435 stop:1668 length:234 start_codon:yes stop_codon:yes gene_type:complete